MAYYVYILKSEKSGDYYKGVSQDYLKRLEEHNSGKSRFTSAYRPWILVFVQLFPNKSDALKEELRLKKCNRKYLEWLIQQPHNILNSG